MPQSPMQVYPALNSGVAKPLLVDGSGYLLASNTDGGELSALNITAATVVKASAGFLSRVSVIVAGSAAGSANDCATTGAAATANEIAVIPNTVGVYNVMFPTSTGIVITPGTGQTIAVSYR
jgi:hypothetical protein